MASSETAGIPLAGGLNNEGILLHQLGSEGFEDCPSWLIEKRTPRLREALLHQRLLLWQESHPLEDLLPRVYGVLPADRFWRLFLAYVPSAVEAPMQASLAGRLLATLGFRFHRLMGQVHDQEPPVVRALLRRQYRRLAEMAAGCEVLDLCVIRELVDGLAVRLAPMKLVMAHNDLHWANIRGVAIGESSGYQLIDLGSAGWNLAGAEFHSQMRESLMGGVGEPLWPHAIRCYSELSGTPSTLLKLSALWYGLVRTAAAWKRACSEGSDRRRRRESRLLTRLVSRLGHELMVSD